MMRSILIVAIAVTLAIPLAGCGRKGMPYEPEDAVYPRTYPYTPQPSSAKSGSETPNDAADPAYQPPKPRPPANLNFRNGY